jgi:hypothetical protein
MARDRESHEGLEVGAATGGLLVLTIFTLLIPTNEFRARLYFLLDAPGDGTLKLALLAVLTASGLVALGLLRMWSRWRALGGLGASAAHVAVLGWDGGWRWLPEFQSPTSRAIVMVMGAALVLVLILRTREGVRRHKESGKPVSAAS